MTSNIDPVEINAGNSINYMNSEYMYVIVNVSRPNARLFMLMVDFERSSEQYDPENEVACTYDAKTESLHLQTIVHQGVIYVVVGIHQMFKDYVEKIAFKLGFNINNSIPVSISGDKEFDRFPINHPSTLVYTLVLDPYEMRIPRGKWCNINDPQVLESLLNEENKRLTAYMTSKINIDNSKWED